MFVGSDGQWLLLIMFWTTDSFNIKYEREGKKRTLYNSSHAEVKFMTAFWYIE